LLVLLYSVLIDLRPRNNVGDVKSNAGKQGCNLHIIHIHQRLLTTPRIAQDHAGRCAIDNVLGCSNKAGGKLESLATGQPSIQSPEQTGPEPQSEKLLKIARQPAQVQVRQQSDPAARVGLSIEPQSTAHRAGNWALCPSTLCPTNESLRQCCPSRIGRLWPHKLLGTCFLLLGLKLSKHNL
jgi:hypothetical protein